MKTQTTIIIHVDFKRRTWTVEDTKQVPTLSKPRGFMTIEEVSINDKSIESQIEWAMKQDLDKYGV